MFIHQNGTQIVDGQGTPILLRGVGLGNWLLPEGYMWRFFDECDSPRHIEKLMLDLLGEGGADQFWKAYYSAYITKDDIRCLKAWGLNSVRLPMNARHLMRRDGETWRLKVEGVACIDRLLAWCKEYEIYVILDMHGAPGGQTGTNIDDSENRQPMLFEEERFVNDTVWLWRQLAERYADNPWIAGYDLLNEPLPNWFSKYNEQVLPLYRRIVEVIREVDPHHLIILEGVHWATDWHVFLPLKENRIDNCMLQFHKYWNNADTESIQQYLDMRDLLQYPIYMGEGGENNLAWYTGVFHLLEQHNISWNFWSYKKMDTHNSFVSYKNPKRWNEVIGYINGGEKPVDPQAIMDEFAANICFENCTLNHSVQKHVTRQAPLRIPAIYFDIQPMTRQQAHTASIPLRQSEQADIRFVCGETGELSFKHYAGEDDAEEQRLCLAISNGKSYTYSFDAIGEPIKVCCRSKEGGYLKASMRRGESTIHVCSPHMREIDMGRADQGLNILTLTVTEGEVEIEWIQVGSVTID